MRRSWTASVSAALLCLAALGAGADWSKDYQAGRGKCKAGQYAEAIPLLQKAIQDKPKSCVGCIRTGMFFEDYFPLYYLGQALMETGRAEEAADCFDRLQSEGLIQKSKELAGPFQMALQNARSAKKPSAPAVPPAAEPPAAKPAPEPTPPPARVEPVAPPPAIAPPPKAPEPSADPEAVQAVRRKLDAAGRQLETLDPAELRDFPRLQKHYQGLKEAIQETRGRLVPAAGPKVVADAADRAARLQAQVPRLLRTAELLRELRGTMDAVAGADLRPHTDLAGDLAALRERMRGTLQRPFDARDDREADAQIAALEGILKDSRALNDRIAQRLKAPAAPATVPAPAVPAVTPPAPAAPPAAATPAVRPSPVPKIREGFEAFFKGDLDAAEGAARALESMGADHPYAHLLLGAVAWTRYAADGSVDSARGQKAREAFAAAKRTGAKSSDLPQTLFSPKLIAFFEQAK